MEVPDIARVIASYLDNLTLQKVFLAGAIPCLVDSSLAQCPYFWHSRVETLIGRRLEYQSTDVWRETYQILSRELEKKEPKFCNDEDNSFVCEILLILNFKPDSESLITAAVEGRTKIMQFLLREGSVNPNKTRIGYSYYYLIVEAAKGGHEEIVKLLLADPRVKVLEDNKALVEACRAVRGNTSGNYSRIVKLLLDDGRININRQPFSVLMYVPECGDNHEILQLLLADKRLIIHEYDDVVIHASASGREKMVALLLQDGRADPSLVDNLAMVNAVRNGHIGVVRLLLADKRIRLCWHIRNKLVDIARNSSREDIVSLLPNIE